MITKALLFKRLPLGQQFSIPVLAPRNTEIGGEKLKKHNITPLKGIIKQFINTAIKFFFFSSAYEIIKKVKLND